MIVRSRTASSLTYTLSAAGMAWVLLSAFAPGVNAQEYIPELLSLRAGGDPRITADAGGLTHDYIGGEPVTAPREGDTTVVGDVRYTWDLVETSTGEWEIGPGNEHAVAYWTFCALSFQEQEVLLRYRHSGGLRIWAGGSLVVDEACAGAVQEGESGIIHLKEGITRFLFKVHRGNSAAFFAARLMTTTGEPAAYIANFDRGGVPAEDVITLLFPPSQSMSATVDTAFQVGETLGVTWGVDPSRLDAGVAVEVSPDDGKSWYCLVDDLVEQDDPRYNGGDTALFTWTIPESLDVPDEGMVNLVSQTVRVRVWSQYATGTPAAISGSFAIVPATRSAYRPAITRGQVYRRTGGRLQLPFTGRTAFPGAVDLSGRRIDNTIVSAGREQRVSPAAGVFCIIPISEYFHEKRRSDVP